MGNDLESKVVLLSGGASGIGRECALAYGREGSTVAILDRNFEEAQATAREITGCILPLSGGAELGYRR
jgi:NAD(P)-dependent dehydrogenase (short-subunit alcohol dehydrogenase family)